MTALALEMCPNCGFARLCSTLHPVLPPLPRHLLVTNEGPTDTEAAALQGAIGGNKTRIAQLDNTIAALQAALETHRRLRQAAADRIRLGTAILSVVRRLPIEILAEIFQWTVPDEPRKRATERSPWVLGRVCSRWRAISQSLPALWTNIDRKIPLKMLKVHLDRSIPYLLTVEVGFSEAGSQCLIACSERWETADVEMRPFMEEALAEVQGRLPALRRLKYNDNNGWRSFEAFAIAPALRDVALAGMSARASLDLP
ncbi:hypothetical protein FB451DRAFT_1147590 [Mycena latifolia]|nr:hypothetical protein FB451DRAFT_1147590 [Mycena latifolia]